MCKKEEEYVIESLTFIDFFSGIGGFRKGLELCGMTCKGHCEIDKYADKSYRAIFDIKEDEWYAEDITKVKGEELPRVNIWTAGFPCQDISVSGKQRGLAGERSSLFFEIIRLLKSKNTEDRPEWLIFENVKNLFSVNKGWDFATILTSLAEVGYNIEYGLLNSKFHSVPQNRERVYIVAYRHFRADSRRKVFPVRASDAKALIQLIGGRQGDRVYDSKGISCTLTATGGGFGGRTGMYFIDLCKGKPTLTENARCIKARYDNGISNLSADKSGVLCLSADCSERTNEILPIKFQKGNPKINDKGISNCISAGYNKSGVNNRGEATGVFYGCRAVLTPDREKKRQNGRRFKECGEPAFCLTAQDKHGVYLCSCSDCEHAMPIKNATKKGYAEAKCNDVINLAFPDSKTRRGRVSKGCTQTLDTSCNQGIALSGCGRIRKLTPRECFRLQGFSDEMFDKAAAVNSDSQLYKQAGNSVTIPVVYAVGSRIIAIEKELMLTQEVA